MDHAKELNKLIQFARTSSGTNTKNGFKASGFQAFEKKNYQQLGSELKNNNLFFSSSILGMEAISHVIEDQAINLGGKYSFYTDFQKFSRLRPQRERYEKLCHSGNPVTLFGVADTQPAFSTSYPNLKVVKLEDFTSLEIPNLSHYWIVVLNNPQFVSIALVANEIKAPEFAHSTTISNANKLIFRNFEGFWTYDQTIIDRIVKILEDCVKTKTLVQKPTSIQV